MPPTYKIEQLLPANGIEAVMAGEDFAGEWTLTSRPMDFIALAMETHHQTETTQTLVGIVIVDGVMEVVNHLEGFCGLRMPGQEIQHCLGSCDPEILRKLEGRV